jgi:hypothetical protein
VNANDDSQGEEGRESAILLYSELIAEAQALGVALLDQALNITDGTRRS